MTCRSACCWLPLLLLLTSFLGASEASSEPNNPASARGFRQIFPNKSNRSLYRSPGRNLRKPRKRLVRRYRQVAPPAVYLDRPLNPDRFVAALVADVDSGVVFYGKNIDQLRPIASLTKLMLSLLVLERIERGTCSWSAPVTASSNACQRGGSSLFLRAGETLPLEDLMRAVLIKSANDAAYVVAEYLGGGDVERCIAEMNLKAVRLGLSDSLFFNPDGLPPPKNQPERENRSSAKDLFVLAREVIRHPEIFRFTATPRAWLRGGKTEVVTSNRLLLKSYPGMDGLKTGFYQRAGFNFIGTATRGGRRLITVVLGAPSNAERFTQAASLLNLGFSSLSSNSPLFPSVVGR